MPGLTGFNSSPGFNLYNVDNYKQSFNISPEPSLYSKFTSTPGLIGAGAGLLGMVGGFASNSNVHLPRLGDNPVFANGMRLAKYRSQMGLSDAEMASYMSKVRHNLSGVRDSGSLIGEYGARTGLGGFASHAVNQQSRAVNDSLSNSYLGLLSRDSQIKRQAEGQYQNLLMQQAESDYKARLAEDQMNRSNKNNLFGTIGNFGLGLLGTIL